MTESRFVDVTYIRTTPERLWRALLEPDFTRRYWVETWQESAWQPGASWRQMIHDGRVGDSGEIVEIDPQGDMVKRTLIHEIERPASKLIEEVAGGWPLLLASLKSLLETGEPLAATTGWPAGL